MTRALAAEYDRRLDFARACHCGRGEASLLPPRPSGEHPLLRGDRLHGCGRTESLSGRMLGKPSCSRQEGRGTFRGMAGAERAECEAKKAAKALKCQLYWTPERRAAHAVKMKGVQAEWSSRRDQGAA
jgi:hypothetical protein